MGCKPQSLEICQFRTCPLAQNPIICLSFRMVIDATEASNGTRQARLEPEKARERNFKAKIAQ
jgi:hypothetical protein